MQRLPCIWCAALSAAGQRSAACLRSNPAAVHPSAVCVLHAGGSAANAQLAPSSGISAASAVHLVRCIISSRAEVSRLPAVESAAVHPSAVESGSGLCAACWRKCHQCPASTLQRHQCGGLLFIWCAASSAAGQRSAACLRSNLRRCIRQRSVFGIAGGYAPQ